jgi:hypothetical protein
MCAAPREDLFEGAQLHDLRSIPALCSGRAIDRVCRRRCSGSSLHA